ncbi:DNA repair protein RadC [Thermoflexus sp.]|uniref:RadC family protein n=2 Tax=Thermoflexus sp. TaxID=1969742 RepID=UPI0025FF5C91|nr:DNA repair protein RadC [Thermoflexus sp.]MCS6963416.1 DNA repair protein RadC [Thermoflexus sp.]MCX7689834.1 DNA repair protein RadC [Thermoflexus sp.]MDW8183678.1 DNA repair protein RadC [Anaerolineae bacterium]
MDSHPASAWITMKDLPESERPRERLIQHGPAILSAAELLAILLRTGRRGENALYLAHRLLQNCGGLAGLARTPAHELARIPGVGLAKAAQIQAALELGRRVAAATPEERPPVRSAHDAYLLLADMADLEQETLRVLLLDTRGRVLAIPTIYVGNVNTTLVRPAEIFREAIRRNAVSLIIAHNHPSGDPAPSPEDIALTRDLVAAGRLLGIGVLDHLIIGRGRYTSLREHGVAFHTP